MRREPGPIAGALCILIASAAIGFGSNAIRSDGLPLIRKPLRETRAFAGKDALVTVTPAPSRESTPITKARGDIAKPSEREQVADSSIPIPNIEKPESVSSSKTQPSAHQSAAETKKTPVTKHKAEALFTTLQDAKSLFDKKAAIFVDARPIEDYEAEHISGAISLYCEQFDALYGPALGSASKEMPIVTFCSDPECREAVKLADALVARGHTKVVILLEGLPGWKDAGYPTATGKESGK